MIDETTSSLFGLLILSLGNAALVEMGLIPEPGTTSKKVNLEAAKNNIEIIAMLEEKTKGNLTPEENKLLSELIFDLRMKFIEASRGVC